MKLQINSTEKIIRIEEKVNLGELFSFLEEILPDMKWREYSIEGNVVYNVSTPFTPSTPIYTPPPIFNPNPYWVTCHTSSTGEIK